MNYNYIQGSHFFADIDTNKLTWLSEDVDIKDHSYTDWELSDFPSPLTVW